MKVIPSLCAFLNGQTHQSSKDQPSSKFQGKKKKKKKFNKVEQIFRTRA